MSIRAILAAALIGLATGASAQSLLPCDWQASAANIMEPWREHSRTYANGDVRVAILDTVEPAAGSLYVLLLSPPRGDLGERQCRVIGVDEGIGFSRLRFDTLVSRYYPDIGLMFQMPVEIYSDDQDAFLPVTLTFSVNQATGEIGVEIE
ncbi:MAG: hypothetical protein R3256_12280 [Thalassovita sp.]|nr:hypothetical protein [Thalassovita sp.]